MFIVLAVISFSFVWPITTLVVKRLKDMDENPILVLAAFIVPFIPIVGWFFAGLMWLWLMIGKGTQGPNLYGPSPHERSQE